MPENSKKAGQFKKGISGNPGGRPKGSHLQWCRDFADSDGKRLLLAYARQKRSPKIAMQALTLIFAYGYGKPSEHHEHSGTVTLEQLLAGSWEGEK